MSENRYTPGLYIHWNICLFARFFFYYCYTYRCQITCFTLQNGQICLFSSLCKRVFCMKSSRYPRWFNNTGWLKIYTWATDMLWMSVFFNRNIVRGQPAAVHGYKPKVKKHGFSEMFVGPCPCISLFRWMHIWSPTVFILSTMNNALSVYLSVNHHNSYIKLSSLHL